jgi:hypothetical protein
MAFSFTGGSLVLEAWAVINERQRKTKTIFFM